MRLTVIAVFALCLIACAKEVRRDVGQTVTETREISCTHSGLCYSCGGITLDGKSSCGIGFHPNCEGHQSAEVRVTPITIHYDNGSSYATEQTQIVRRLDACQ